MSQKITLFYCVILFLSAKMTLASILPPNDLHLELSFLPSNISEEEFNQLIDHAESIYQPIVANLQGELVVNRLWKDNKVNANATRSNNKWIVNMYGGLARRQEITADAFTLVICHELGHHLAGYPKVQRTYHKWAASEGQSDYFATLSCARELWTKMPRENTEKAEEAIDESAKALCEEVWSTNSDQNLCYRALMAAQSVALLLARGAKVGFDSPDKSQVSSMKTSHPAAQCRLDTFVQGALCIRKFDIQRIPQNYEDSLDHSCSRADQFSIGTRPLCWYKPPSE